jgi:hypothetical protein
MSLFKYLLKPLVAIIILQMVLMPIAPVLAQELNQSDTTTPIVDNQVAPVPVANITESSTVTIEPSVILEPDSASSSVDSPPRTSTAPTIEQTIQENNPEPAIADSANINQSVSSTPSVEPVLEKLPEYSQIMRRLNRLDKTKEVNSDQLERFIQSEKARLDKFDLDGANKSAYFDLLDQQLKKIKNEPPTLVEKIIDKTKEILGLDNNSKLRDEDKFRIPPKPAEFKFNNEEIKIETLENSLNNPPAPTLLDMFNQTFKIDKVSADDSYLPTINDVKSDNEAVVNSEIMDLARQLNNNPVKILNYVRQNIAYEPYFGAKKGSLGCLREKVCNDFDASSLTISLLRAAGIPARYKKSVVEMSADQIKNLLGIDELKTAYLAWAMNKVPVYTLSAGAFNGKAEDYDFSNETALGLEWVFVEAYYDYDERAGNVDNILSFASATTTADVQNILQGYSKKQWIPLDAVVKIYNRTKNEIVHDTANFNTQNFWNGFLQYSGSLSPLQKYAQDLKNSTGKDIYSASFQSTNVGTIDEFQILPPTLPYYTHTGEVGGSLIQPVAWSAVPDNYRAQVKISLLKDSDKSVVFEHSFFGSEINNAEINLAYDGATDADKQVIDSYGGLHATPATLVNIKPYILAGYARYDTNNTVKIGDQLILHFDYLQNNNTLYSDEKFSIAGNSEGMAIVLSRVQVDPNLDTNSKILLQGNSALASKYLQHVEEASDTLKKVLDYRSNIIFSRAVVTQNRILSEVNGAPTTFDFKGLTIDASSYINDWSNRGLYKNHRQDFRLLWGLDASYYEGQLFDDITGLNGISTVKGLQYAYAHPAEYTVHTITKANENIIDTLSLTANTKQNMHTAVQAGNTVVTPDKAITDGGWNGVLYIVLLPEGCATYAIGEQTQMNGGNTINTVKVLAYQDTLTQMIKEYFVYEKSDQYYAYEDGRSVDGIQCAIKKPQYDDIKNNSGWNSSYGFPCWKGTVNFGSVQHVYILASNGAKFFSPDKYNKWYSKSEVENKMNAYINNIGSAVEKYTLKFSSILGTYRQPICTGSGWKNCDNDKYETVYFIPDANNGQVYRLKAGFLDKADKKYDDNNKIISLLGFPTSDEMVAATSKYGTGGNYQNFVNGQMYYYKRWAWPWVYYTYGKLTETHNANGGTNGNLGFPENDPINRNGMVYQEFEGDQEIGWNLSTGATVIETFKKYRCELYKDVKNGLILSLIMAQGIFDTGVKTVDDIFSLIMPVIKGVINIGETSDKAYEMAQAASKISKKDAIDFLKSTGNAAYNGLIDEYNTSFGPNGCQARANYVGGRIAGEILLIYVPASKLKAVSKVKLTSKLGKDVKMIAKLGDVTENTVETLNGVAKVGKFEGKPVFGVLKKYISSGEANWYNKAFDYPGFQLKNAVVDGYLKGDLQYGFYSLKKAINDDYLLSLTQKGDEIIYVLKQDGEIIISPRGNYKFPHPILSGGADVRSAGTIKFKAKDLIEIDNSSGHFYPSAESLDDVKSTIQSTYPNVKIDVIKKFE